MVVRKLQDENSKIKTILGCILIAIILLFGAWYLVNVILNNINTQKSNEDKPNTEIVETDNSNQETEEKTDSKYEDPLVTDVNNDGIPEISGGVSEIDDKTEYESTNFNDIESSIINKKVTFTDNRGNTITLGKDLRADEIENGFLVLNPTFKSAKQLESLEEHFIFLVSATKGEIYAERNMKNPIEDSNVNNIKYGFSYRMDLNIMDSQYRQTPDIGLAWMPSLLDEFDEDMDENYLLVTVYSIEAREFKGVYKADLVYDKLNSQYSLGNIRDASKESEIDREMILRIIKENQKDQRYGLTRFSEIDESRTFTTLIKDLYGSPAIDARKALNKFTIYDAPTGSLPIIGVIVQYKESSLQTIVYMTRTGTVLGYDTVSYDGRISEIYDELGIVDPETEDDEDSTFYDFANDPGAGA